MDEQLVEENGIAGRDGTWLGNYSKRSVLDRHGFTRITSSYPIEAAFVLCDCAHRATNRMHMSKYKETTGKKGGTYMFILLHTYDSMILVDIKSYSALLGSLMTRSSVKFHRKITILS